MKKFILLLNLYIFRDLVGEPRRTLLTLLGVALGIGVVVAIHQSSDRAVGSFSLSLATLSGSADYQITNNGLPLDERLLAELRFLWDWGQVTPLIEGRVRLGRGLVVNVFGVDLLGDSQFRDYFTSRNRRIGDEVQRASFLSLLTNPRALIVPASLADRLGVAMGDELPLFRGDQIWRGEVASIVQNAGTASAFGGNVIFMDLGTAQSLLQKTGELDRIDFKLAAEAPREELLARVRQIIPETAFVRASAEAARQSGKMLEAFSYNLRALSYLSLILGVILIYNTLNLAAVRRCREVAALRTLGASRGLVLSLFLCESVLLGVMGSAIGLWFGQIMGSFADSLVRRTVETLYLGFSLHVTGTDSGSGFYVLMLGLGAFLGLLSGTIPSLQVSRVSPVRVLREGFLLGDRYSFPGYLAWSGLAVVGLGAGVANIPNPGTVPVGGYASAVLLIGGMGMLTPELSGRLLGALRSSGLMGGSIEKRLALDAVERGLPRLVVAVISLSVAVSLLVSIFVMVGSFRRTVIAWIDQTWQADLYVSLAGATGASREGPGMPPHFAHEIAKIPGVQAVSSFRARTIEYGDIPVTLAGADLQILATYSQLLFVDGSDTRNVVARLVDRQAVIVSEPFALKQRVRHGQQILLPTPTGSMEFVVEGIYYDYSSDRGLIVMDQSTYGKLFHDRSLSSMAVYVDGETASVDDVRQEIGRVLAGARLFVARNSDLRKQALRVFDQTFRITYALEIVAILVAVLGITNTLGTLMLERRGEIAILKFLGADRGQLRRMTLHEALLTGILGLTLGCMLGIGLSLVLIYVINRQAFGWTIQFDPPWISLLLALVGVLTATLLSGLYPAQLVTQTDAVRSLRAE